MLEVAASTHLNNVEDSIAFPRDGCQWIWYNRIPSQPTESSAGAVGMLPRECLLRTWHAKQTVFQPAVQHYSHLGKNIITNWCRLQLSAQLGQPIQWIK